MKEKILEMGGFYKEDFIRYFENIGGVTEDNTTFKGLYWQAEVGEEKWTKIGALTLCHITVTINAEENKFEEFLKKFRLNFLKAGG